MKHVPEGNGLQRSRPVSGRRFDGIAQLFHWGMAFILAAVFAVAFAMEAMPLGPAKVQAFGLHKSLGLTVLALVVVRIFWRLTHPAPAYGYPLPIWQTRAAQISHGLLYLLMVAQPIIGLLQSQAANFQVTFWRAFQVPALVAPDPGTAAAFAELHGAMGFLLLVLICIHVGAALYHMVVVRDEVFARMVPAWRRVGVTREKERRAL